MYVQPSSGLLDQLTELIAVGNYFDAAKLHLFKSDSNPTPQTVLADLTEATGTGYASVAITWGTPFINDVGYAEVLTQLKQWIWTNGATDTQTIFGYYFTNTGSTTLLLAERFANPIIINRDGQAIDLIGRLVLGQQ
jgi:hypothetical protein